MFVLNDFGLPFLREFVLEQFDSFLEALVLELEFFDRLSEDSILPLTLLDFPLVFEFALLMLLLCRCQFLFALFHFPLE